MFGRKLFGGRKNTAPTDAKRPSIKPVPLVHPESAAAPKRGSIIGTLLQPNRTPPGGAKRPSSPPAGAKRPSSPPAPAPLPPRRRSVIANLVRNNVDAKAAKREEWLRLAVDEDKSVAQKAFLVSLWRTPILRKIFNAWCLRLCLEPLFSPEAWLCLCASLRCSRLLPSASRRMGFAKKQKALRLEQQSINKMLAAKSKDFWTQPTAEKPAEVGKKKLGVALNDGEAARINAALRAKADAKAGASNTKAEGEAAEDEAGATVKAEADDAEASPASKQPRVSSVRPPILPKASRPSTVPTAADRAPLSLLGYQHHDGVVASAEDKVALEQRLDELRQAREGADRGKSPKEQQWKIDARAEAEAKQQSLAARFNKSATAGPASEPAEGAAGRASFGAALAEASTRLHRGSIQLLQSIVGGELEDESTPAAAPAAAPVAAPAAAPAAVAPEAPVVAPTPSGQRAAVSPPHDARSDAPQSTTLSSSRATSSVTTSNPAQREGEDGESLGTRPIASPSGTAEPAATSPEERQARELSEKLGTANEVHLPTLQRRVDSEIPAPVDAHAAAAAAELWQRARQAYANAPAPSTHMAPPHSVDLSLALALEPAFLAPSVSDPSASLLPISSVGLNAQGASAYAHLRSSIEQAVEEYGANATADAMCALWPLPSISVAYGCSAHERTTFPCRSELWQHVRTVEEKRAALEAREQPAKALPTASGSNDLDAPAANTTPSVDTAHSAHRVPLNGAAAGKWNQRVSSNGRAFARRVIQKAGGASVGAGGRQELSSIVQAAPDDMQRRVVI